LFTKLLWFAPQVADVPAPMKQYYRVLIEKVLRNIVDRRTGIACVKDADLMTLQEASLSTPDRTVPHVLVVWKT
jgi:hypothetical protein